MSVPLKRLLLPFACLGFPGFALAAAPFLMASIAQIRVTVSLKIDPTVTVIASDPNAAENQLNWGAFTLTRTGDTNTTLGVRFTLGGTASHGVDYDAIPQPVVFPPGVIRVTVAVKTRPDAITETKESVTLTLSPNSACIIGSPASATVNIYDRAAADGRLWSLYE